MSLTPKQLELVRLVWTHKRDEGRPPNLREIGEALGISRVSAWERAHGLLRRGVLLRKKGNGALGLEVPGPVAEELGLLEARHERIRARAAAVARKMTCGCLCAHEACKALERAAKDLERMDLAETL